MTETSPSVNKSDNAHRPSEQKPISSDSDSCPRQSSLPAPPPYQRYTQWALEYDARTADFHWSAPAQLLDATLPVIPPAAPLRMLDVGVGTGQASRPYLEAGACVIGLDIAPAMLAQAQQRWPQFHLLIEHDFNRSFDAIGLHNYRFELVLSCGALHFAEDLANTLQALRALLAPGGVLAFTYISPQQRVFSAAARLHESSEVAAIVEQLGLQIRHHSDFIAYYEGGNGDDPVVYRRLVAHCPEPAIVLPEALGYIDRCACIDRERLRTLAQRPLLAGPITTQWSDDLAAVKSANEQLLQALHAQVATGEIDLRRLPLPQLTALHASEDNRSGCDVLVLLAHPDDESVYAGGLIAGLTEAGNRVHLVVVSDGGGGRQGKGPEQINQRSRELHEAAQALGIETVEQLGFADFGKYRDRARSQPITAADTLRRWGLKPVLNAVVTCIRHHRPRVLLTFDPEVDPNYSLHGHHLAVGVAAVASFHLAADPGFATQEPLSPWAIDEHHTLVPRQQPGSGIKTVEIDPKRKLQALAAYASQRYSTERLLAALENDASGSRFESYRVWQRRRSQSLATAIIHELPSPGGCPSRHMNSEPTTLQDWRAHHAGLCQHRYPRTALTALLIRQAQARDAGATVLANIERLRDPTTVAVVTGQQVGVLGGPAYTLYKALGAVALARHLRTLGITAVPVFWLASYDHDLDEVQKLTLLAGADGYQGLTLGFPGQGQPVGTLPLGRTIEAMLAQVQTALADLPHGAATLALLRRCYQPQVSFASAFTQWLGALTDTLGLVLLDPATPEFAALTHDLLHQALFDSAGVQMALTQAREHLALRGRAEIIPTAGQGLQVFYTNARGERRRLQRADRGFTVRGGDAFLSDADIDRILAAEPQRFTPSALLRPLCQDSVLPTIAYVAGPSEQGYWQQLPELYRWAGLPMPQVIPRPTFTLLNSANATVLADAGGATALLGSADPWRTLGYAGLPQALRAACAGLQALVQRCHDLATQMRAGPLSVDVVSALEEDIWDQLNAIELALALGDKKRAAAALQRTSTPVFQALTALGCALERSQTKGESPSLRPALQLAKALTSLEQSLIKEGRRQFHQGVAAWKFIRPRGLPQERELSVAELVARYGFSVVERLLPLGYSDGRQRLLMLQGQD